MFDAEKFCQNYNIDFAKKGKHLRQGWMNIPCKFCNSEGFHLGINMEKNYCSCWHCGYHSLAQVICKLTHVNFKEAKDIEKRYGAPRSHITEQSKPKIHISEVHFPSGTITLTIKARKYLIDRKFNPEELIKTWGILSTAHYGFYKHRILAPIYINGQLVSFQTRDITGKASQKYLACGSDDEIIHHQNCIYGMNLINARKCIIVEGITDCWRLGVGSVCTFGIAFTKLQARMIAKNFEKVFILYDSEEHAQEQADKLSDLIGNAFTNPVEVINLPFLVPDIDPGDLSQDDADSLMVEIGLR